MPAADVPPDAELPDRGLEDGGGDVELEAVAALAAVHDDGLDAARGAGDAHLPAAVAALVEEEVGYGDDAVGVGVCGAAGAEGGVEVGYVARVLLSWEEGG